MSDLSAKFTALEEQLLASAEVTDGYIDTVEEKLQLLFDTLDVLNVNNAANTRAILQALAALDPCACAGTPTLIVPPPITTPIEANTELCQRIQAFLHTIQEFMVVLDVASAFSVGLNFSLILNSFNQVINDIESGEDLPIISYPEAVNLVGVMINYIAGNLLVGSDLTTYFSSVILDLRDGMVTGTDAESMKALYDGVIDASDLPSYVKPVIKGAAYNAVYSYYFDPGTSPNLDGYDGGLCGFSECIGIDSSVVHAVGSGTNFNAIIWPSPFNATNTNSGSTWDANVFCTDNLAGWTITATANVRIYELNGGTFNDLAANTLYTFNTTNRLIVYDAGNGTPFSAEICPP